MIKRGGVGGGGAMARLGLEPSGPVSRSGRPYKGGMMKFITIFFILDLLDFVFHSFDDQALSQDM